MARPVESPSPRPAAPKRRRVEIDRTWVARFALLVVVAVGFGLVARVSMIAFGGSGKRLERFERQQSEGAQPARASPAGAGTSP